MADKQLTILEAVRALTVGDCPTRREAVKTISEYCEAESNYHKAVDEYREVVKKYTLPISILDKIRAEIVDLADSDAYGDYQQGFNFGLMRAAQIIDKCKAESEDE